MQRTRIALWLAGIGLTGTLAYSTPGLAGCLATAANRPVCPAGATPEEASFIDPTVAIAAPRNVRIGTHSHLGPFVRLRAPAVDIGDKTDLQDSVVLDGGAKVALGDEVILAHGARVTGPARIGRKLVEGENNAAFIGFNSWVHGASVEHDAMVLHLARVKPGITIKAGHVVLSGKEIRTQAEADDFTLGKVIPITDALRAFMAGVLHVNEAFAKEYSRAFQHDPHSTTGINFDPGNSDFNPLRDLPTLAGMPTQAPQHRNHIVGKIALADTLTTLNDRRVMGEKISLRADEGEPFHIGHIKRMGNRATFHALEHTAIDTHDHISYGRRSLVHGGVSAATAGNPESATVVGERSDIADYAIVFRSVLGKDVKVGCGSLVDGSTLPDGAHVPARTVMINNTTIYPLEWNPGCRDD